jgi:hypothetical protein
MAIDTDLRHLPFVFSRFDGEQTRDELDGHIALLAPIYRAKKPWVSITFANHYSRELWFLRRMAAWIKETETPVRDYCVAVAIVAKSPGLSFVLSTVFLIQPLPCPYKVCHSLEEANAFVRAEAAKRGLVLPPGKPFWLEQDNAASKPAARDR